MTGFIDTTDRTIKTTRNREHFTRVSRITQQISWFLYIQYSGLVAAMLVLNTVLHRYTSSLAPHYTVVQLQATFHSAVITHSLLCASQKTHYLLYSFCLTVSRLPCYLLYARSLAVSRLPCYLQYARFLTVSRLPCYLLYAHYLTVSRLPCYLLCARCLTVIRLPCYPLYTLFLAVGRLSCYPLYARYLTMGRMTTCHPLFLYSI